MRKRWILCEWPLDREHSTWWIAEAPDEEYSSVPGRQIAAHLTKEDASLIVHAVNSLPESAKQEER